MASCRFCAQCFRALAVAAAVRAPAGTPAADSVLGFDLYIGACRVDSSLISCAREFYPFTAALIFLLICVGVATFLVLRNREHF
jgi:hypothetical protein